LPGRKFAPVTVGECNREVCVIETGLLEGTRLAGGRS
jgi:hypothetical protein